MDFRWEFIYTNIIMGIYFNGTDIDRTKEVFFNGTSVDKVFFNGTEIWEQGIDDVTYTDTRRHCIDHFLYVKYDGNGKIEIAGAEPSGAVHTGRGDCGGYAQGWYTAVDASSVASQYTTIAITVVGGSQGGGGGTFTTTRDVTSSFGNTNVTTYTDGGATAPQISVTVTLSGG